jgi:phage terminase Nu1 subunit (DNA packaging protein)
MITDRKGIADIFGVTTRTIDTWQKEGLPVVAVPGRPCQFDTVKAIEWRLAKIGAADGEDLDYNREKARLTKAQADKAEMEAEELRENLIPADEVAKEWGDICATIRTRLLAIPTKLAHKLANIRKISEAEELLREAIHQALEEIASEADQESETEGGSDGEAAPEPDREPVGGRKAPAKSRGKR